MEIIIAVFGIGLIIIAAVYLSFRVKIKLFISRTIRGPYNYKHFLLYSKYTFDKPYPDAIKYEPLYFIQYMFNNKLPVEYQTDVDILFYNLELGSENPRFYKTMGKPNYLSIIDENKDGFKIAITGYNRHIYNYESSILFFFSGSLFILGQYMFKREKQHVDPAELIPMLNQKYKIDADLSVQQEFIIRDKKGTCIHFADDGFSVNLTVYNPISERLRKKLKPYIHFETVKDSNSKAAGESITF